MTSCITVELGERSYPIWIGQNVLQDRQKFEASIDARQVVLITNEVVAPLYADTIRQHFTDRDYHELVLPDGEATKTLHSLEAIMTFLLERRIERRACLIALGGGVTGDLVGFAAACYQRGVRFVQVPTTLLAQVDSSVGGKTAVNHPLGKNMIGAFYQPEAVFADTEVLKTLPAREYSAGLAEVIKYGLIRDCDFLDWIDTNLEGLLAADDSCIAEAVRRSCENKAAVVAADEREGGIRAILNLGHTFGHAIETAQGYGNWLHGEAVGAGMCMAAIMSKHCDWLAQAECQRVLDLVTRARLPAAPPADMTPAQFIELMGHDKKNIDGVIRLVLLRQLGQALVTSDYPAAALEATLNGQP